MPGDRKAAQEHILKYIGKITGDKHNVQIYERLFASMNDKQFEQWIDDLDKEKTILSVTIPNFGMNGISIERNLEIAKELGVSFFQHLWIEHQDKSGSYKTPVTYMVVDLPVRRASQILKKKISVPESNKSVDVLTGQFSGNPRGASISYVEMQVLAGMGLDNTVVELIKYRGGDRKGFTAMNAMIGKYGKANLKTLANFASGVESTKTFSTLLTCAHLKNNLV